jgi:hypothetical protein
MSTRELQQQLTTNLREWQKLENAQINLTGRVLEDTNNPVVSLVMEIIQRDSQMHHRVQQLIIDSLESEVVSVDPADVVEVRAQLRSHLDMEKETVRLAEENLAALANQGLAIQEFLMDFLHRDEQKHRDLLIALDTFLGEPDADQETARAD